MTLVCVLVFIWSVHPLTTKRNRKGSNPTMKEVSLCVPENRRNISQNTSSVSGRPVERCKEYCWEQQHAKILYVVLCAHAAHTVQTFCEENLCDFLTTHRVAFFIAGYESLRLAFVGWLEEQLNTKTYYNVTHLKKVIFSFTASIYKGSPCRVYS